MESKQQDPTTTSKCQSKISNVDKLTTERRRKSPEAVKTKVCKDSIKATCIVVDSDKDISLLKFL